MTQVSVRTSAGSGAVLPKDIKPDTILRVDGATKTFSDGQTKVVALCKAFLDVPKGKITAVLGPNGSGKSTLLGLMSGIIQPDRRCGKIEYNHPSLGPVELSTRAGTDMTEVRNCQIATIYQGLNLDKSLTVAENVALPLMLRGIPRGKALEAVAGHIRMFGLDGQRAQSYPNRLSGGQQQRVAICRALVSNAKLILADEPTARLDSESTKTLMNLLSTMNQKWGTSIVIVTHDNSLAKYYCDCYVRCQKGDYGNTVSTITKVKKD